MGCGSSQITHNRFRWNSLAKFENIPLWRQKYLSSLLAAGNRERPNRNIYRIIAGQRYAGIDHHLSVQMQNAAIMKMQSAGRAGGRPRKEVVESFVSCTPTLSTSKQHNTEEGCHDHLHLLNSPQLFVQATDY
jgi:hypothetical protein